MKSFATPRSPASRVAQAIGVHHSALMGLILGKMAVAAVGGPPVEWALGAGGNGHVYQLIESPMDWESARAWAEAHHGYLVTATSAAENSFVRSVAGSAPEEHGYVWLGGMANPGQCSNPNGWSWVTGEAWGFTAWQGDEPNYPDECRLAYRFQYGELWNNYVGSNPHFFIVEWDADCDLDGIADYGQIASGLYEDLDGDGRPDCCDFIAPCGCPSDLDRSGFVGGEDLQTLLVHWGSAAHRLDGDINEDGVVDGADLSALLICWGDCNGTE